MRPDVKIIQACGFPRACPELVEGSRAFRDLGVCNARLRKSWRWPRSRVFETWVTTMLDDGKSWPLYR